MFHGTGYEVIETDSILSEDELSMVLGGDGSYWSGDSNTGGGLAAGDLDYDGVPEIVAPLENGRLQILNNKGELIHTSDAILIGQ